MLHSYQQYLPINVAGSEKTVNEILQEALIQTEPDNRGNREYIPLRELVTVTPAEDLKSITAGRNGEYVPFDFLWRTGRKQTDKGGETNGRRYERLGYWILRQFLFLTVRCWMNWW